MFSDDPDDFSRVTFEYNSEIGGIQRTANITVRDKETYREIVQQFVYFMQAIGYSYIEGITVHGPHGKDLHTTDM